MSWRKRSAGRIGPPPMPWLASGVGSRAWGWRLGIVAVGVIVVGLLVGVALKARKTPADWEASNYSRILEMKREAEALAISGKLSEAHAKYREIQALVGNRQIKNPQLWDVV